MNRWMLRIMVFVLALSVLGGCAANGKNENAGKSGKVKIEYWYGLGSVAGKKMKQIITEFNASHKTIEVVGVAQPDYKTTYQKLQASVASGNAPGIALLDAGSMNDLGKKKALEPLDSYVSSDKSMKSDDFLPVFTEPSKIEGKTYGLPAYGTTQVTYFRKDIFSKAGIDPKEAFASWENLTEAAKKIQKGKFASYGYEPMWGADNLIDIALSNGGTILSDDGKKVTIDSKEWVDAWEMVRKAVFVDKTMKINSGGQGWEYWYKTIDNVMKGQSAGYTGSSGDKGDLDFTKIDSAVQPGMGGNTAKPNVDALYLTIPRSLTDAQKKAAYEFVSYFTSPKVNASWAQAIGYIPVRNSAMDDPTYAAFLKKNPYAAIPFKQAQQGTPRLLDPTGGKITQALSDAADQVELQNVPAKTALAKAQKAAQAALDAVD